MNHQKRQVTRGAASVEAVVALPVFVILFVGMFFVRDLAVTKLLADEEARRCAWLYSANGCKDTPPGCKDVLSEGRHGSISPKLETAIQDGRAALTNGVDGQAAVARIIENLVGEALLQAFTRSLDAKKTVERDRPGLFGGGKSQVTGKYRLACNLQAQESEDIVGAAWHQFRPKD